MNTSRIKALLHYDWVTEKRSFLLATTIIAVTYLFVVFLYFLFNGITQLDITSSNQLPYSSAIFCAQFFSYAQIAMVLFLTQVLHSKFTNPRTSLSYLTLPGTNAEKWLVMIAEYIIGWLTVQVLFAVMFVLTSVVGNLIAPHPDWIFNPFFTWDNDFMMGFVKGFSELEDQTADSETLAMMNGMLSKFNVAKYFSIFVALFQLGCYVVVNMCFRSYGQLKTIACGMGFGALMGVVGIACMFNYFMGIGDVSPSAMSEMIIDFFNYILYFYYSTPLLSAAVLYLFYWQICKKQAK